MVNVCDLLFVVCMLSVVACFSCFDCLLFVVFVVFAVVVACCLLFALLFVTAAILFPAPCVCA